MEKKKTINWNRVEETEKKIEELKYLAVGLQTNDTSEKYQKAMASMKQSWIIWQKHLAICSTSPELEGYRMMEAMHEEFLRWVLNVEWFTPTCTPGKRIMDINKVKNRECNIERNIIDCFKGDYTVKRMYSIPISWRIFRTFFFCRRQAFKSSNSVKLGSG